MAKIAKKKKPTTLRFEPTAYIQRLFGRDLISSESIAVAELVKNAYDAGANQVKLTLFKDGIQRIIISDDGRGMSITEFERLWMRPGYSEKSGINPNARRPYLGEKGIGRFAADKLSSRLNVITKTRDESDALYVFFDWSKFENRNKKIREISFRPIRKRDEELPVGTSGTRLELQGLRKEWRLKDWIELRAELQRLIVPSGKALRFTIIATVVGKNVKGWSSGEIEPIFKAGDAYEYFFSSNKKGQTLWSLVRPTIISKQIKKKKVHSKTQTENNSFGAIKGRFYYLRNARAITKQGYRAGVGIYRDGFIVEPYGSEEDDWLEIKYLKASRQGHAPISPSKLFGYVEISRAKNPKLVDVTNREGIQDSEEFEEFRNFVQSQFRNFSKIIEEDNESLPVGPSILAQQEQKTRETRARAFAQMASQLAHQLRQPLNHIRMSSTNLVDRLQLEGINDPIVVKLTDGIQRNVQRMSENITSLSKVAKGLKDEVVDFDLATYVKRLASMHRTNFEQGGVRLDLIIGDVNSTVKYGKIALTFILDNFLTNALRAASEAKTPANRVVVLKLEKTPELKHRITVSDNGKGIPASHRGTLFNQMIPSEHGDGAGLFWSRIWAEEYGGRVGFLNDHKPGAAFYVEF